MSKYNSKEWHRLASDTADLITTLQANPKVPLGKIAEALGITVKLSTLPANISGEIRPDNIPGRFVIRINRHETKPRQRFTLAHEIAHYLLHRDQIGNGIADNVLYRSTLSNSLEAEANRLAADILMPWSTLERQLEGKNLSDEKALDEIAETLGVSKVALKIRLEMN